MSNNIPMQESDLCLLLLLLLHSGAFISEHKSHKMHTSGCNTNQNSWNPDPTTREQDLRVDEQTSNVPPRSTNFLIETRPRFSRSMYLPRYNTLELDQAT